MVKRTTAYVYIKMSSPIIARAYVFSPTPAVVGKGYVIMTIKDKTAFCQVDSHSH